MEKITVTMPKRIKSDLGRLKHAMKVLEDNNFVARLQAACCSSCAWHVLGNPVCDEPGGARGICFTNNQSHASAFKSGNTLLRPLYFQWDGDAKAMLDVLQQCGFKTVWNGTKNDCFAVVPENYNEKEV